MCQEVYMLVLVSLASPSTRIWKPHTLSQLGMMARCVTLASGLRGAPRRFARGRGCYMALECFRRLPVRNTNYDVNLYT